MTSKPVKISKYLLDMKFMKRTKEKEELRAEQEAENHAFRNKEISSLMKEGNRIVIEPRFGPCEMLKQGRMSFKGMNPEIEKLMTEERDLNNPSPTEGISPKEMANRYSSLVDTMAKKFSRKRARSDGSKFDKSKKFKKPRDD